MRETVAIEDNIGKFGFICLLHLFALLAFISALLFVLFHFSQNPVVWQASTSFLVSCIALLFIRSTYNYCEKRENWMEFGVTGPACLEGFTALVESFISEYNLFTVIYGFFGSLSLGFSLLQWARTDWNAKDEPDMHCASKVAANHINGVIPI